MVESGLLCRSRARPFQSIHPSISSIYIHFIHFPYKQTLSHPKCMLSACDTPKCSAQARVTVVKALDKLGLFRGITDNPMRIGVCSRSKDVIEPCLKPQWWVQVLASCASILATQVLDEPSSCYVFSSTLCAAASSWLLRRENCCPMLTLLGCVH